MVKKFEKAEQLLGVSVPVGNGKMTNGDGGEVAVGASVKSARSSPKKTSSFMGRCDDCGENGHRWRDCQKQFGRGGDGVRKGFQQSQDACRTGDNGANRSGKSRSNSTEKPKVVSPAAVSQGPSSRSRALKEEGKGPWSRTRMRQQGGDRSVSHRAVFVEPRSWDDGDGEHMWVKMPRAAIEEQLAAGPESCSIGDSESEASVTRSRRVTGGTRMEALGGVDIGAVDVEPLQFHCSSNVVVPGDMVGDSMTVGTVLDSESGITCLSERLARQMEQHFRGERLVHPCVKEMSVQLANGQKVVVRNQTRTLQVAIGTPWDPVVISTVFAVIPGTDSVLILGSKTLREKLVIDVMASLKSKAQGCGRLSGDMPEDVDSRGGISLRRVAVTMKGMRAAGKVAAATKPRDEFVEDVVARGPATFMEVGDEVIARREALMAAVDAALEAGLPSDAETRLRDLLLGPLFDGFRRSLSGDPPARVEPFQVKLKVDVDLSKVKARPRVYLPAKTAWLDEQFAQLADAGMVYGNPQAICSNPAKAVPKGNGYRSVGDFKAVNQQSEPVAAPPMLFEEQASAFAGAALFMTVDLNQGYWQMPLAANSQELFTFVTQKGLYAPTRMPQGVTNATSYFQGTLERTLGDLVRRVCLVYVDDAIIWGRNVWELMDHFS